MLVSDAHPRSRSLRRFRNTTLATESGTWPASSAVPRKRANIPGMGSTAFAYTGAGFKTAGSIGLNLADRCPLIPRLPGTQAIAHAAQCRAGTECRPDSPDEASVARTQRVVDAIGVRIGRDDGCKHFLNELARQVVPKMPARMGLQHAASPSLVANGDEYTTIQSLCQRGSP